MFICMDTRHPLGLPICIFVSVHVCVQSVFLPVRVSTLSKSIIKLLLLMLTLLPYGLALDLIWSLEPY